MPNKEPKYIDADVTIKNAIEAAKITWSGSDEEPERLLVIGVIRAVINTQPPAPVRQEVHAAWTQEDYYDEDNGVYTCSNCKEAFVLMEGTPEQNLYDYCPKCGSRMDLDAKGE